MDLTTKQATSSCAHELLVPLQVARKANKTKVKAQAKSEAAVPVLLNTTADSGSLFL